jgi:hypothetical protein
MISLMLGDLILVLNTKCECTFRLNLELDSRALLDEGYVELLSEVPLLVMASIQ